MPILKITLPDGTQLDHELTDETLTVGRAGDNTISIEDPSMSGHHAQVGPGGEGYVLTDIGSTNGTTLNGQPCTPETGYPLSPGDVIIFGKIESVFDPSNAAEGAHALPEDKHTAAVAKSSVKPSNFMNASPFQKRTEKKDPIAMAAMGVAGVAILVALVVIAMVFSMSAGS